jgi:hypothetical protein
LARGFITFIKMKNRLIILILVIAMTIIGANWTLHRIRVFLYPEIYLPAPPVLTVEEIRVLENYLGIVFPESTQKVYAYYKAIDRYHLFIRIDFAPNDGPMFLHGRNWIPWDSVEPQDKEGLTSPLIREYGNWFIPREVIPWGNISPDKIRYVFREKKNIGLLSEALLIIYEDDTDVIKAHIVKHRWSDRALELDPIFSTKANWDLRESDLYPLKPK